MLTVLDAKVEYVNEEKRTYHLVLEQWKLSIKCPFIL